MPVEPSLPARRTASPRWLAFVLPVLAAVLLLVFPPFRVLPLKPGAAILDPAAAPVAFDAVTFSAVFWAAQLQPAAAVAPEWQPILVDLRRDPVAAAKQHGRQVGLGGPVYFFAQASGRVTAVERGRLLVAIDGEEGATVALRTGPVFGNTVRDGCGLLEVNRAPGLQEFNAISAELNRLVEERVLPVLKAGVVVGAHLTFAGCAEAPEKLGDGPLLTIIPVQAEVKP